VARKLTGELRRGQTVVVTVTGHGLKDIDTSLEFVGAPPDIVVDPDPDQAARAAGLRDD
jgi:threonine synthase